MVFIKCCPALAACLDKQLANGGRSNNNGPAIESFASGSTAEWLASLPTIVELRLRRIPDDVLRNLLLLRSPPTAADGGGKEDNRSGKSSDGIIGPCTRLWLWKSLIQQCCDEVSARDVATATASVNNLATHHPFLLPNETKVCGASSEEHVKSAVDGRRQQQRVLLDILSADIPIGALFVPGYVHQHTLLIPIELVTQTLVQTSSSFSSVESMLREFPEVRLVILPAVLPADSTRRAKNDRLIRIHSHCGDAEYNAMVNSNVAIRRKHGDDELRDLFHNERQTEPPCEKETFAVFMRDVSIGLDMRLMTLAGGVVGYYLCYVRGFERGECIVGAAVGAVIMLFVDAVLLVIRMGKQDLLLTKKKKRKVKEEEIKGDELHSAASKKSN